MAEPAAPDAPIDIEKPASFYLGREYDLAAKAVRPDRFVLYDARDLTTHGVVVGMTGSGKTGLSIALLEEAAIDGIPCVIIDPKGDLTNLLLQFPNLSPQEFAPWVSEEDARQKGIPPAQLAEQLAARWKQGLAETAQTPERIARLRAASDYRIYTPGSEAGLPLSILGTFAAPKGQVLRETLTQKIDATATALLGLGGIAADPMQSREHILVAQLLLNAWTAGRDLDLAGLIQQIQTPPIRTVGAYNLETFFPARDRLKFASALNNVLAAPGFSTWRSGEALDLGAMLYKNGRPQQLIFYVAHLDDTQRMFFVTLLLEEVLNWTRRQSGTTNLRALVYFDEVFGYLPPHPGNPPSKGPLLTLLKQARAFGVGVLLATQNPVDLDYKALSNAGTWFVGKLQTERDKARLLDGLETVAGEHGTGMDRRQIESAIASLGNRVFLLHSIHHGQPRVFQSRWALSFLRGPMTREQVHTLMAPLKEASAPAAAPTAIPLCTWCHAELTPDVGDTCPACGKVPWAKSAPRVADQEFRDRLAGAHPVAVAIPDSSNAGRAVDTSVATMAPVLPPDVNQFYLPAGASPPAPGAELEYHPFVLGGAEVTFVVNKRAGVEHVTEVTLLAPPPAAGTPIDWEASTPVESKFASGPSKGARWAAVPESLDTGRKLRSLEKAFGEYLYGGQKLSLWENRALGLMSEVGESEAAFRERSRAAAQAELTKALEMEKVKFRPKFQALDADLPPDNPGASLLGWLSKWSSPGGKEEKALKKLQGDYEAKRAEIKEKGRRAGEEVTAVLLKPRKVDVRVTRFGLAWVPYWRVMRNGKAELVSARDQ